MNLLLFKNGLCAHGFTSLRMDNPATWIHSWRLLSCAIILLAIVPRPAVAVELLHQTFEDDGGGWQAAGVGAKVTLAHGADVAKEGEGALRIDYTVAQGTMGFALMPVPDRQLAEMKSIKFWLKCDHAAPIALVFQEKDEGRYVATFSVPANTWQAVELSPSDFILTTGPDDPKDPDGKLEMEKVSHLGLIDLGQIYAQAGDTDLARALGAAFGPHVLFVDEIVAGSEALPTGDPVKPEHVAVDRFLHPQADWACLGGAELGVKRGDPLGDGHLSARYHQSPGKIVGWIKALSPGLLTGMNRLDFRVASQVPAILLVQLEDTLGGKYNTIVKAIGSGESETIRLQFADFNVADDSKVKDGHLDLSKVKQLLIADASGLVVKADSDNALLLSSIIAGK